MSDNKKIYRKHNLKNKMIFLDLKSEYKSIKKEVDAAIRKVLDSGRFIGGTEVESFEKK